MLYSIHVVSCSEPVNFAADELKKYLRMMMPDCGEIFIDFDPKAETGFRLGLMSDLGIPCTETDSPGLDDVVYIDTDETGGILAGSNPRSVLFAVYRFLKLNGCRWIFPGIDGEKIPLRNIAPTRYRKMAAHRFRGQCNEGSESQECMMDTIDFNAKLELNSYMLEFANPYVYYEHWYNHEHNPVREAETVSKDTVLQWKRQCEAEISRRGLSFHDMGHGWTADPFGFDSSSGWSHPEETDRTNPNVKYLAEIDGVRELWGGISLNTNLCLSQPFVRTTMARAIADYAEAHQNVNYLHIWMADGNNNHCECAECRKKRPTDWYVMMLNEADALLTERKLPNKLVCIAYYDTLWSPETERLKNPDRFVLLFAPLSRNYCDSYDLSCDGIELRPYDRNRLVWPTGMAENLAYLHRWQQDFPIDCFSYEYHMYVSQYASLGGLSHASTLYHDIRGLKSHGLDGIIEDGSQRSFFPNGFLWYVYGETLFDPAVSWEALKQDYFEAAYGSRAGEVLEFLENLDRLVPFARLFHPRSKDPKIGVYYDPEMAEPLQQAADSAKAMAASLKGAGCTPVRAEASALLLLNDYCTYISGLCEMLRQSSLGNNEQADVLGEQLLRTMGEREVYIQKWYDQGMMARCFGSILNKWK